VTASTSYVLTGSPDNFRATRERRFSVIGMKEGRRRLAEAIEVGDRIVLYLTQVQAFGAIIRVTGPMYEDREPISPGKPALPGKPGTGDPYPWRFETEPEIVLPEDSFLPAEEMADELEHVRKWPREHWQLAFQGQLRAVSPADAALLERRMRERRGASAAAAATA